MASAMVRSCYWLYRDNLTTVRVSLASIAFRFLMNWWIHMHVFVTGATGWVGTAVVDELLQHGHRVLGLSRSPEKAQTLKVKGADVLHATLDDLDSLRAAARAADGVIHLAFNHDFSRYTENAAQDRLVIDTLGDALQGSDKPLLVTSTLSALRAFGRVASEADLPASDPSYPRRSEEATRLLGERGVRAATIRLPSSVHGVGETHGFVPMLIDLAREKGVSAYIGEGANRWPAVHVADAARLYRMALEGATRQAAYHAVADSGVRFREIAERSGTSWACRWSRAMPRISVGSQASPAKMCPPPARQRDSSWGGNRAVWGYWPISRNRRITRAAESIPQSLCGRRLRAAAQRSGLAESVRV
ncbi:SDR family oxidoreductase [Xanthomonas hortorum pv. gardneri]|nr:SDR family oxidoreductase [Xanthomonas hortorum]MCC8526211.1 SDR family oxidoreductase [Xanthomonas hortorum pv. gardneri]MCC8653749.1 SDR family oxidoreductase [Xanthomonas hortorum pv. gardneri]MCC8712342.1 SDR family oxidoreductase [Xanthomonas hortorum pv. gardneri]MCC8725228.1 SDR family oxidoreductase [Xanthomonas hortorum pv. gardneri]MCC8733672.1 SDR family oxidoreductase [Xanthomonas hortorum pv. gardneri]